jgi:hypothetical protein
MAFGSLREVNYQFGLAIRLAFIKEDNPITNICKKKLTEAEKVLGALLRTMC